MDRLQINSPVLMGLRDGKDLVRLSPADREAFKVTITAALLLVERAAHGAEVSFCYVFYTAHSLMTGTYTTI